MKLLPLIAILFYCISYGQEAIVLKTFVKEEGLIQLRWAPTMPSIFQDGLNKGYVITRSGSDGIKEIVIAPLKDRKDDLKKIDDPSINDWIEFAEGVSQTKDENMLSQSFGMLTLAGSANKSMAKVLGFYFEDKDLSGSYTYQVKIKGSSETSNEVKINSKKLDKNPDCSELKGYSRIDLKEAYMEWEAANLNPDYGGYWILKSENKKDFVKMNETPLFHFTSQYEPDKTTINYVDTTVLEGHTYYYKVQPINHFGDPGIESNIIEVYIQKRLTGLCIIDTVEANEYDRKIVGFYQGKPEDEVQKFVLLRSQKVDSVYNVLEETNGTSKKFNFNFKADLLSGDRHYFKVAAISPDGDTAFSYPYYHFSLDQEPPGIPNSLEGIVDSNGIARLKWVAPEDKDLMGYRVFRSNSLKEEFVELTTRLDLSTNYTDTLNLNNLTSEVYYFVRAVDQNYNNGKNTEPILLMKPDTIPPVPGAIKFYKVSVDGVLIKWANSPSTDLANQYLIRTYENRPDTILSFQTENDSILDQTGRLGLSYRYYLLAVDKSGNQSQSQQIPITYEIGYRNAPKIEDATANLEDRNITLTWSPIMEPIYSIQIYRAKNDGSYRLYETIRENISEFIDKDLSINNIYHYKIKVNYDSGISSKMSDSIEVMY
ncbi:MAG: fibronectin type III domain-containing protein [Crocinitomicaceae bacterium]|nr:fibronectin type III domain-containing protein [Crocinitomicaceae bacterium]